MAWNTDLTFMLRAIIGDLDSNPTYTDVRLQELLVVAAHYVKEEITGFSHTYKVTISSRTISPDPTTAAPKDDAFSNFVVLKAACMIDQNTLRAKTFLSGIRARCGPAMLETLSHIKGFESLIDRGPCATYQDLKDDFIMGKLTIKAVLSPFVSNTFDPRVLGGREVHGRGEVFYG